MHKTKSKQKKIYKNYFFLITTENRFLNTNLGAPLPSRASVFVGVCKRKSLLWILGGGYVFFSNLESVHYVSNKNLIFFALLSFSPILLTCTSSNFGGL